MLTVFACLQIDFKVQKSFRSCDFRINDNKHSIDSLDLIGFSQSQVCISTMLLHGPRKCGHFDPVGAHFANILFVAELQEFGNWM